MSWFVKTIQISSNICFEKDFKHISSRRFARGRRHYWSTHNAMLSFVLDPNISRCWVWHVFVFRILARSGVTRFKFCFFLIAFVFSTRSNNNDSCIAFQALCEKGLLAMENSHRRIIAELEEKHRQETESLKLEKEQALAEETHATLAGEWWRQW